MYKLMKLITVFEIIEGTISSQSAPTNFANNVIHDKYILYKARTVLRFVYALSPANPQNDPDRY